MNSKSPISFVLDAVALLAVLAHPGHILMYVHRDALPCRRGAIPIILGIYPYFIDIKNNLLSELGSRVVLPITEFMPSYHLKKLMPMVNIDDKQYLLMAALITSISIDKLTPDNLVGDVSHLRDDILSAIDFLITGI